MSARASPARVAARAAAPSRGESPTSAPRVDLRESAPSENHCSRCGERPVSADDDDDPSVGGLCERCARRALRSRVRALELEVRQLRRAA